MNIVKSHRLGDDKEEFSESASVAGARSSYGGASMGQSRKGSMFDVGLESGRSPIPEEEGSIQDHQDCKLINKHDASVVSVSFNKFYFHSNQHCNC